VGWWLSGLVRRASATLLIWAGSITLGLADVLYAGLVPGPRATVDRAALALACTAGAVFVVAATRGLLCFRASTRGGRGADGRDAIAREAEWGIAQLEAWLRRQDHSRDG
jgi:hypothetical protein